MARTVVYVGDEALVDALVVGDFRGDCADEQLYDVDVPAFVVAAEVVHLADAACVCHGKNTAGVVVGVYPVAYVQPATVDWQGFAREDVVDHKRYKLLGVLVWPVVVRAAGDAHRQSEGVFICQYHKVGRRFGSRIWRRGSQRRAFAERHRAVEPTLGASAKTAVHIVGERASFGDVDVEVAVYLVGAYVHELRSEGDSPAASCAVR